MFSRQNVSQKMIDGKPLIENLIMRRIEMYIDECLEEYGEDPWSFLTLGIVEFCKEYRERCKADFEAVVRGLLVEVLDKYKSSWEVKYYPVLTAWGFSPLE